MLLIEIIVFAQETIISLNVHMLKSQFKNSYTTKKLVMHIACCQLDF